LQLALRVSLRRRRQWATNYFEKLDQSFEYPIKEKGRSAAAAQKETIYNWQSVALNDQVSVLDPTVRQEVLDDLAAYVANPGSPLPRLKYKPIGGDPKLPHEFAIAFRYGHSQLRDAYFVRKAIS
jgi:hypothetical protein